MISNRTLYILQIEIVFVETTCNPSPPLYLCWRRGFTLRFSLLHWLHHWPGDALTEVLQHCLQPSFWRVCILLTRKHYKHSSDSCAGIQIAKVNAKGILIIKVSFEHHHNISLLTLLRVQPKDGRIEVDFPPLTEIGSRH